MKPMIATKGGGAEQAASSSLRRPGPRGTQGPADWGRSMMPNVPFAAGMVPEGQSDQNKAKGGTGSRRLGRHRGRLQCGHSLRASLEAGMPDVPDEVFREYRIRADPRTNRLPKDQISGDNRRSRNLHLPWVPGRAGTVSKGKVIDGTESVIRIQSNRLIFKWRAPNQRFTALHPHAVVTYYDCLTLIRIECTSLLQCINTSRNQVH